MKKIFYESKYWLFLIVIVHIYLLMQLVFFPYPELFVYSHLTQKGLIAYKQIFDQHFPGLMFFPINLFSMGFSTLNSMRILHLAIAIASDLVFFKISRYFFQSKLSRTLLLALYVFWQIFLEGHVLWIESFITPILMLSFLFFLKYTKNRKSLNIIFSVLLMSFATVFKQTTVPLAILFLVYLYFVLNKKKEIIKYTVVYLLPISLMLGYFMVKDAIFDFVYWTFTFNMTIFSQMGRTYPEISDIIKLVPSIGLGLLGGMLLITKKRNKLNDILIIYFFGCLFFSFARYDPIHLQPALPYSILLIGLLVENIRLSKVVNYIILFVYFAYSFWIFKNNYIFYHHPGLSPMFNDNETLKLLEYFSDLPEDKTIFSLSTYPHLYYLLDKTPPGDVFVFQFPWFMKITENRILDGIMNHPPDYVIRNVKGSVGGFNLIEYMNLINNYVSQNYESIHTIGENEILQLK